MITLTTRGGEETKRKIRQSCSNHFYLWHCSPSHYTKVPLLLEETLISFLHVFLIFPVFFFHEDCMPKPVLLCCFSPCVYMPPPLSCCDLHIDQFCVSPTLLISNPVLPINLKDTSQANASIYCVGTFHVFWDLRVKQFSQFVLRVLSLTRVCMFVFCMKASLAYI